MNIETNEETLRITGVTELSAASARALKEQVAARFIKEMRHIDFDASSLQFLDSSGLGALISMLKMTTLHGGNFRLLAPTPPVIQILELTRLHRVFEIVPQ
ncbi:MAG: STAS domain-containing protein [Akkermansiaceae bacterium]|jgi:anti-sigma B factor antagonist